jgi:tetratricopeptide (TPR) repeat protein
MDTLMCGACRTVSVTEDWIAPLVPLLPGRCYNCGARYGFDGCSNCELTIPETDQVHDELRALVAPGPGSLLEAAQRSARDGRLVMALKLATAAGARNELGRGEAARALRVWILSQMGYRQEALDDAKAWVDSLSAPSALAFATLGARYESTDMGGAAAEAYGRALQLKPDQHGLRAKRARLLVGVHRTGQALSEVQLVLEKSTDEKAITGALEVAGELCDNFQKKNRDGEVAEILTAVGRRADTNALLCFHRGRLAAAAGKMATAKRDLRRAVSMDSSLKERAKGLDASEEKPAKSWWRPW